MSQNHSHTSSADAVRLSYPAGRLLRELRGYQQAPRAPGRHGMVYIADTGGSAYWAYEQLRNAVEYQEQHLLMRSAISRYLMRTFAEPQTDRHSLGFQIVRELTKARYLSNGTVSNATLEEIDRRLVAYRRLYDHALHNFRDRQRLLQLLVGVISSDVQHILVPNPVQDSLLDFVYHSYHAQLAAGDKLHTVAESTALYAAVHRVLLRSDVPTIHRSMFENQFPGWSGSEQHIKAAAVHLKHFFDSVEAATQGSRAHEISRMARRHIAPYVILYHTLTESAHPDELLAHPEKLTAIAEQVAEEQYKKAKLRLHSGVFRTVIFLLITKTLVGLSIEIPYEYWVLGGLHPVPLIINLLFPPAYMLLIALTIKTPDRRNTEQIIRDLKALLYGDGELVYTLRRKNEKSEIGIAFNIIYTLCTLVVLGSLGYILSLLQFNIVSGVIFFIFFSTVSFFGYRISQSVRELVVVEKRDFFDMLWGVVTTPFIRFGQWLSDRYSRFNIFLLFLDFIIEAPYKTLLRVYEQWTAFLREKQDDVLK